MFLASARAFGPSLGLMGQEKALGLHTCATQVNMTSFCDWCNVEDHGVSRMEWLLGFGRVFGQLLIFLQKHSD